MQQNIHFCRARDGVRIAYAVAGSGPPLVKAANWLNHLEFDWQSPVWRHLFEELASRHTLVRYDERGNGLSDWDVADLSFEAFVSDLETVVDAAGLDRFPLLGISQGGAVAVAYAVRHPERVSHLILHGAYAKGWAKRPDSSEKEARDAMVTLIRQGWGQDNPAFRQMWSTLYIPEGTREQLDWFNELQRISTSPENAERLVRVLRQIDVSDLLPQVRTPTLVIHSRGDAAVPFEAGRGLAARIPGARFVELSGRSHLLLESMLEWPRFCDEVRAFLGDAPRAASVAARAPSPPLAASPASGAAAGTTAWRAGTKLAHYRIAAPLGAGGMGVVYRARDTRLERDVALKVLPESLVADATARARLVREARTASALNHPNICHIYEVGEAAGHSYIAMEHVAGRPLAQSIPADGLPVEDVLRYARQLAEALAHAHDRNVLHRDLKSSNVMVTPEGRVKVLDFGLAKRSAVADSEATRAADSVTQAGSVAGTLHYLAPEVLRGQPADARSDLWALGVVLYEMASGKLPFTGGTGFEASAAILRELPATLPPHVPAGLRAIIARCLAKDLGQRYQRAGELRAALEAVSSDTAAVPLASSAAPALPAATASRTASDIAVPVLLAEEPTRHRWQIWAGGILLLLLAIFAWDNFFSQHARQPADPVSTPPAPASPAPAGPRLSTGGTPSADAEANSYFEKSRIFLGAQLDLPRARQLLEKALEADPKFAEARAFYALTDILLVENGISNETAWLYKGEQECQQALRDEPGSPSARGVLGAVFLMQGKKELGGRQIQEIFRENPQIAAARIWLARYYLMDGDYAAGIRLTQETLVLMPVFWINQWHLGVMRHQSGDSAGAVREFAGILEQDPQNLYALKELARQRIESGDTKAARTFLERARPADRRNYRLRLAWALLHAREGKTRDARREMNADLLRFAEINPNQTLEVAEFYALMGDTSSALDWLEKAVRNGDERTDWFRRNPLLDSIRREFRFKSILDSTAFRRQQKQ